MTQAPRRPGRAGKFSRHRKIKGFDVGKDVSSVLPSPAVTARNSTESRERSTSNRHPIERSPDRIENADEGVLALKKEADRHKRQARQLRRLAAELRLAQVEQSLSALFKPADEMKIDLLRAAPLVSRLDNDDLNVDAYLREVDRMAATIRASLQTNANGAARSGHRRISVQEARVHGSRTDFNSRSNSYLNEVIDDREGLPITLSVLYIELARRLDVKVVGIGAPGQFFVRIDRRPGKTITSTSMTLPAVCRGRTSKHKSSHSCSGRAPRTISWRDRSGKSCSGWCRISSTSQKRRTTRKVCCGTLMYSWRLIRCP